MQLPENALAATGRIAIDAAGHEVALRRFGSSQDTLLVLHGGPGGDSGDVARFAELADADLQVVLYDQLGGGQSDRPSDPALWTVERYVEELETVRRTLELGAVHLCGVSWGGTLALQYTLERPEHVKTLAVAGAGPSMKQIAAGIERLRAALGDARLALMRRAEAEGAYDDPAYLDAAYRFYARHVRRSAPYDEDAALAWIYGHRALFDAAENQALQAMWGPNDVVLNGSLLSWDVSDRLAEIRCPTLILTGLYDMIDLDCHRSLADGIADNELVIFGNSSHALLLEREADCMLGVVRDFVRRKADGSGR